MPQEETKEKHIQDKAKLAAPHQDAKAIQRQPKPALGGAFKMKEPEPLGPGEEDLQEEDVGARAPEKQVFPVEAKPKFAGHEVRRGDGERQDMAPREERFHRDARKDELMGPQWRLNRREDERPMADLHVGQGPQALQGQGQGQDHDSQAMQAPVGQGQVVKQVVCSQTHG